MTAVTPVKYDATAKKHEPFAAGDTIAPTQVPVSAVAGNQIQVRDDGLYYGATAPVAVNPLYVDGDAGVDTNDGLSANTPLKTLGAALTKQASAGTTSVFTVFLKAGQTFTLGQTAYNYGTGSSLYFRYYGDATFGQQGNYAGWWPEISTALNKPTIVFDTYAGTDGKVYPQTIDGLNDLHFQGVNVTNRTSAGKTATGAAPLYMDGTMEFVGSVVSQESVGDGTLGSAASIIIRNVTWQQVAGGDFFFIADDHPSLTLINAAAAGTVITSAVAGFPDVTVETDNTQTFLKPTNAVALTAYDATTKSMFGFSANWDIFASS